MPSRTRPGTGVFIVAAVCLCAVPLPAPASGARTSDKANHGEIVLLRNVHARHAYRAQPPGIALIADPSPRRDIDHALGTGELSLDEYAALGAANGTRPVPGPTTIERVTHQALSGPLGVAAGSNGALPGSGVTGAISGQMGAVHRATGGIADQVRGALSGINMPAATSQPPAGGPGGG